MTSCIRSCDDVASNLSTRASCISSLPSAVCSPCGSPHSPVGGQSPHSVAYKSLEYSVDCAVQDDLDRIFDNGMAVSLFRQYWSDNNFNSGSTEVDELLSSTLSRLISLRLEYISRFARPILQRLMSHPRNNSIFNAPVDAVALGLTNYHQRIIQPRDLGTIKAKLMQSDYNSLFEVWSDVRLVFSNAILFNGEAHLVGQAAVQMSKDFEHDLMVMKEKTSKEISLRRSHSCGSCIGDTCLLCGEGCLRLEGPVIQCLAPKCNTRIKKGSNYFVSRDGMSLWCSKCFASQPPAIRRLALPRYRGDEDLAEKWTPSCGICNERMHEICALRNQEIFSSAAGEGRCKDSSWTCPLCLVSSAMTPFESLSKILRNRISSQNQSIKSAQFVSNTPKAPGLGMKSFDADKERSGFLLSRQISDEIPDDVNIGSKFLSLPTLHLLSAKALPRCSLSDFLELSLRSLCTSKGFESISNTFSVRVLSQTHQKLSIPVSVRANFELQNASSLPYTQKCIGLFQQIGGVDTFLFSLYTQEFSSTCPPPNTNCVYVSYLDSVEFLRPCQLRTAMFQELLVSYLAWTRQRGFRKCMLWACPPQRGDSFIFWCKPPGQRTPSRDRLNTWYRSLALRCAALGITDCAGDQNFGEQNESDQSVKQLKAKDRIKERQFEAHFERFFYDDDQKERKSRRIGDRGTMDSSSVNVNDGLTIIDDVHKEDSGFRPTCPPLFEGDFWLLEFVRLHRLALQRQRQSQSSLMFSAEDTRALQMTDSNKGLPVHQSNLFAQRVAQANRRARAILQSLLSRSQSSPFRKPVDVVALRIPHYLDIIKQPMDLSTIRTKIRTGQYKHALAFATDLRLIFTNAMLFNPPMHPIHVVAQSLSAESERLMREMFLAMTNIVVIDADIQGAIDEKLSCIPLSLSFCGQSINASLKATSLNVVDEDCEQTSINDVESDSSKLSSCNDVTSIELTTSSSSMRSQFDSCGEYCVEQSLDSIHNVADNDSDDEMGDDDNCKNIENSKLNSGLLISVLKDVAKAVQRLNDDLFLFTFAPLANIETSQIVVDENEVIPEEPKEAQQPGVRRKRGRPNEKLRERERERELAARQRTKFSNEVQQFLLTLASDTSEPDAYISNAIVDSRHIFLESCQVMRAQFDNIRRAQYSTQRILSRLMHNSSNDSKQQLPRCVRCYNELVQIRWSCCECHFNECKDCFEKFDMDAVDDIVKVESMNVVGSDDYDHPRSDAKHAHPLTPFRVVPVI